MDGDERTDEQLHNADDRPPGDALEPEDVGRQRWVQGLERWAARQANMNSNQNVTQPSRDNVDRAADQDRHDPRHTSDDGSSISEDIGAEPRFACMGRTHMVMQSLDRYVHFSLHPM